MLFSSIVVRSLQMSSNEVVISVKNISKKYRIFNHPADRIKQTLSLGYGHFYREFEAINNVSFDIKKGDAVGIIGRNGSGKSTLLQLLCGILKPNSGSISVNGRITALLELGAGFDGEFSGRENIYFQGALMGLSKLEVDKRFDKIAAFADIGDFIDQPVRTYSSGMYVRLAFANMIHVDSDIIIIDEALAVGDEEFKIKCFSKLTEYLRDHEKVVILVSHSALQIEQICSHALWLDKGCLIQQGSTEQVCDAYQTSIQEHLKNEKKANDSKGTITFNSSEIDITRVFFSKKGDTQPIDSVESHSSFNIVIDFIAHIDLKSPEIIVGFHADIISFITAATTINIAEKLHFKRGAHRIVCSITNLPLMPGMYQSRIRILNEKRRTLWAGHSISTLSVTPPFNMDMSKVAPGYTDMSFEWSVIKLDNAESSDQSP